MLLIRMSAALPVLAQSAAPTLLAVQAGRATRIACVGDSITAGAGASSAAQNYPSLLAAMLGPSFDVANFGESGATLLKHGDSPYWQRTSFPAVAAFAPDAVIVMLGTNDTKPQNWSQKDEFAGDYAALLAYCAHLPSHPQLFVCLPPPVLGANPYGILEAPVEEQIPLIRQAAAQAGATVIDVHTKMGTDPAKFGDGVHPNDAGYRLLANIIYGSISNAPVILPLHERGIYREVQVTLQASGPDLAVRYTLDGSLPTAKSALYRQAIVLTRTTTLKAQAFAAGKPAGLVSAATFTRLPLHPSQTVTKPAAGLAYSYFEGAFQAVAGFTGQTPVATGTVPGFSLSPHRRETDFGLVFVGDVDVPTEGLYTFSTTSDDGSTLSIDGVTVVDNDGLHGDDEKTGQIVLAPGKHAITVRYLQAGGGSSLRVTWEGPGIQAQEIPSTALSHQE